MCVIVYFKEEEIDDVRKFREIVGLDLNWYPWNKGSYSRLDDEDCLCYAGLEKVFEIHCELGMVKLKNGDFKQIQ